MIIRRAEQADVEAIRLIYNQAVLTTTATYHIEPQTADEQQAWFDEHERGGWAIFVAEEGGQVLGWSSIGEYRPRPGYRFTAEDSIYVHEEHRGRGIGTQLLPPAIEAARVKGMHAVVAVLDGESAASYRLHSRFGFKDAGRLPQVGRKFERWLDVVNMALLLE